MFESNDHLLDTLAISVVPIPTSGFQGTLHHLNSSSLNLCTHSKLTKAQELQSLAKTLTAHDCGFFRAAQSYFSERGRGQEGLGLMPETTSASSEIYPENQCQQFSMKQRMRLTFQNHCRLEFEGKLDGSYVLEYKTLPC